MVILANIRLKQI